MTPEDRVRHFGALLGRAVCDARPLSTESRNSVLRVTLDGAHPEPAVLKFYDPAVDPHWANRFRREEKVLTLLAGAHPRVAPRPIAGFIPANGPAMLLMEDAGGKCLADVLLEGSSLALWVEAAEFLAGLHAEMHRQQVTLKRTAMAISLDRLSLPVLLSRFRIAGRRLLERDPEPSVLREFRRLMSPIATAPKAMIHNSMSPLNVVPGPQGWCAIDWETLTWASPLWDWAELLLAPYHPLPFELSEPLLSAVLEGERPGGWTGDVAERLRNWSRTPDACCSLFRRAVLSRHLDSLGTVVQRKRRYEEEGRPDRAAEYARRAAFYVNDLQAVIERLEPPARLAAWLRELRESAL